MESAEKRKGQRDLTKRLCKMSQAQTGTCRERAGKIGTQLAHAKASLFCTCSRSMEIERMADTQAELETKLAEAATEIAQLRKLATDRRYMMEAYHSMLGEKGLQVAKMWSDKRVSRVHHSWGPDAAKLTGEERAGVILEWQEASLNAVPIRDIDSHLIAAIGTPTGA